MNDKIKKVIEVLEKAVVRCEVWEGQEGHESYKTVRMTTKFVEELLIKPLKEVVAED